MTRQMLWHLGGGMRQKHPYFTRATVRFSRLHGPGAEAEQPGTAVALSRSRAATAPSCRGADGGAASAGPMSSFWTDSRARESALGGRGAQFLCPQAGGFWRPVKRASGSWAPVSTSRKEKPEMLRHILRVGVFQCEKHILLKSKTEDWS